MGFTPSAPLTARSLLALTLALTAIHQEARLRGVQSTAAVERFIDAATLPVVLPPEPSGMDCGAESSSTSKAKPRPPG